MSLKSGSDVRGTAIEGEKGQNVNLTSEAVRAITDAFVVWLSEKTGKTSFKIALGHDSRISANSIMAVVTSSLIAAGCDVYDCGLCSTPSIFMMTKYAETSCDAGVMITASHHPYNKNGLKFFIPAGGLESSDIARVLEIAESGKKIVSELGGNVYKRDFMSLYCDTLVSMVRSGCGEEKPLTGFHIVVDAGNGAGGFYATRALSVLGADISGSQFLQPDGRFPNHIPNPENSEAMKSISRCVVENKADLGIIFDTDVDRAAIVASDGEEINRNKLIALISDILLEENNGATIVTDSVTSDGLREFILRRGGAHHRFRRGYKNVIDEAIRLNNEGINAPLAIETSGHAAFRENYFLDDGAYLVTRLIIKMAILSKQNKTLDSLISDLSIPKEEKEIRVSFNTQNWQEYGKKALKDLGDLVKSSADAKMATSNYEGTRANLISASGWFLARMSVHDPIMPINIESDKVGGVKIIAQFLYEFLKNYDGLNISTLKAIL